MRSYTYNPKPSYRAGPAPPAAGATMRSNSLGGRASSMGLRLFSRAGAQNAAALRQAQYGVAEEQPQDDESVVIVTKTTKVVDAYGRTTSVTLETVRKLADGSNIIETKTTNISRPTSRSNSFRANSLSHGGHGANYNLDKIDEDLQDFDYTYLDHGDASPPRLNVPDKPPAASPKTDLYLQEQRKALLDHSPPRKPDDRNASIVSTQSTRRLKSILKSSPGTAMGDDTPGEVQPYPADQSNAKRLDPSPNLKSTQMSNASGTNSIKFHETVETISYPSEQHNVAVLQKEMLAQEEQEKKKNVDLYSQAMKVAMQKVYGDSHGNALETPPASPVLEHKQPPSSEVGELAAKKIKKDHKREHVEMGGVNKNYIYENHHKDFAVRSLRGADPTDASTRKKRVKEEMKLLKEEEKRQAELLKNAQKEKKRQEKASKKDSKKKKHLSIFNRNKRRNSISESVLSTVALNATVSTSFLDHSDSQIQSTENESPVADLPVTATSSEYNDTQEHFVDVPDVIEEDEEEHVKDRPGIMADHSVETLAETNEPVDRTVNNTVPSVAQVSGSLSQKISDSATAGSGQDARFTLVSLPNGHPQVLSDHSRIIGRNGESDNPSPNLGELGSSFVDVTSEKVDIAQPLEVELDSQNEMSPKQRNRETVVLGPDMDSPSDSPSDSPNVQPQIILFEPQAQPNQLNEEEILGSSQQEAQGPPVSESLAGSLSTVGPPLEEETLSEIATSGDGEQLSPPFVLNEKRQALDEENATGGLDEASYSGARMSEQGHIGENNASVENEQERLAADLPTEKEPSETTANGETSTDADVSGVTAHERLDGEATKEQKKSKKQKIKKPSKFKKMIDKYFINSYSR